MVSEPFPVTAPDTRSIDQLNDREKRTDGPTSVMESNRMRLDQNTSDIPDLKFTMSQIQASLRELAAGIASLASHRNPHIQFGSYGAPSRIVSIGLLAETKEGIAGAKTASSAHAAEAAPVACTLSPSTSTPALTIAQQFPLPAKVVSATPGKTVATPHAEKLGKQHKSDLGSVVGSNPFGWITPADVAAAIGITSSKSNVAKAAAMALPQHMVLNANCNDGENFTSQCREGLNVSNNNYEKENDDEQQRSDEEDRNDAAKASSRAKSRASGDQLDEVDEKLKALKLKYQLSSSQTPKLKNAVKLYLHIGGNTPNAKGIISEKRTSHAFVKASCDSPDDDDDDDDEGAHIKGEDADDGYRKTSKPLTPVRETEDLMGEFEETSNEGTQSLTLGALDNSFLVNDMGVQVYRNFSHGILAKGVSVKFDGAKLLSSNSGHSVTKKTLLLRAETNMILMSPTNEGKPHASSLQQIDPETDKVVTEWKFEKDRADITTRDITNDTKGPQLDPSELTFLGLDDNRLCQWDMRHRKGMVQSIAAVNSPVLHWNQGHQFSRGLNFQCFATTGDGSIVVGPVDGKIRLYSKTSMRQTKTASPRLGSEITHVDVAYDGKWVLDTTGTYLFLICTLFIDKEGKTGPGEYNPSSLLHHLEIHLFSIMNSYATVLLLIGFLATILMRILKNDFMIYAQDEEAVDDQEETRWKYIHGIVGYTATSFYIQLKGTHGVYSVEAY